MTQAGPDMGSANWRPLYRLGGIAALLAVFVFRRNLGAELMVSRGLGLFSVPETAPVRAGEWFALQQREPLVGLALFEAFDLVEYALVGLIFLAVCVALWETHRATALVATVGGLVGVGLYGASNQAFAMLSISEQYAAATTDAQRALFLAAGEALLAMHNPGTLHQGMGIYASLGLVLLAGLLFSVAMLRSGVFGRLVAITGILANGLGLGYYVALAFAPAWVALPFVLSAPLRMVWYFLIARKLLRIGKER